MRRLRLAVVGAGHLGQIHARIAANMDGVQLVGVVDSNRESGCRVAKETGATAFSDLHELFGLADAAVVATPTTSHLEVAQSLLQGGLHLLVEKPLAATVTEADALVTLAKRQQLTLQVGHVERFNPALTSVQDRIHDPKYIEARRESGYTFRSTDIGVVLDLMIHDIDVVLDLVQSPVRDVEALGISVLGDHEDMVNARLRFASGCVANLTASRVSYAPQRTMQVVTPTSFASIDFALRRASIVEPTQQVLTRQLDTGSLTSDEKSHLSKHLFADLLSKRDLPSLDVNAIERELLDFVAAIRTGTNPQVTGHAGREAVAVAESILQRVAEHSWDGATGSRHGALALPLAPAATVAEDSWATDDTVIIRRQAG